jgi:hypothetical protein
MYDGSIPLDFRKAMLARETAQVCLIGMYALEHRGVVRSNGHASALLGRFIRDEALWLDGLRLFEGVEISKDVAPKVIDWEQALTEHGESDVGYDLRLQAARASGLAVYPPAEAEDDSEPDGDA